MDRGRLPARVAAMESQGLCSSEESRTIMAIYSQQQQLEARGKMVNLLIAAQAETIESLARVRAKYDAADALNATMQAQVMTQERLLAEKEQSIRTLSAQLNDARTTVRKQLGEINALKEDLDTNVNRIELLKQLLKEHVDRLSIDDEPRLAFLRDVQLYRSHSKAYTGKHNQQRKPIYHKAAEPEVIDVDDDIDYDKTGDSLDDDEWDEDALTRSGMVYRHRSSAQHQPGAGGGRRSASVHAATTHGKRSRSKVFDPVDEELGGSGPKRSKESSALTAANTEVTSAVTSERPSRGRVAIRRSMNRSMSEGQLLEKEAHNQPRSGLRPGAQRFGLSTADLRTPRRLENWTNGQPIEGRRHRFEKLPSFFKITSCDVCNGGINFAAKPAVKCMDCNQHAHVTCQRRLALPCVPKSATPRSTSRARVVLRLQDFCPPSAPMIPAAIIHCVVAIEKRIDYPGIYRIPGRKDQVSNLLRELRTSRAVPKLELQDTEVVTDCVKRFLMELRDPLIPKTSRLEFIEAAQEENIGKLNMAICDLPQPNRDTLAYLMLHWQKVADNSARNKMPMDNLARVLAPTVVGYPNGPVTASNAVEETKKQHTVLLALLKIDGEYWTRFLTFDKEGRCAAASSAAKAGFGTPAGGTSEQQCGDSANISEIDRSMLGPISASSSKTPARAQPVLRPQPIRTKFLLDPPQ